MTTLESLRKLGYHAELWPMPNKTVLHVTIPHKESAAYGASICIPADATLENALDMISDKESEFEQHKPITT